MTSFGPSFRSLRTAVCRDQIWSSRYVANEDYGTTRGRLHVSGKPLEQFTAKTTAAVLLGAKKYREMKDDNRRMSRFLKIC